MDYILLNAKFEEYLAKAEALATAYFTAFPEHERDFNFFPLERDAAHWFKRSPTSCASIEITSINQPHEWSSLWTDIQTTDLGRELTLKEFRKLMLAYVLPRHGNGSFHQPPGFITYIYAPSQYLEYGYDEFGENLKDFGFQQIAEFINPIHGNHKVVMLGCSTWAATKILRATKWPDSSSTKNATIAVPETTSEFTTMVPNFALDATGGTDQMVFRK